MATAREKPALTTASGKAYSRDNGHNKTLTHLWTSANTLLAQAPTVAQHLSYRLASEGKASLSTYAKSLMCPTCGTITWTPLTTRIRPLLRAVKGRCNRVVRRCAGCQGITADGGSYHHHRLRDAQRDTPDNLEGVDTARVTSHLVAADRSHTQLQSDVPAPAAARSASVLSRLRMTGTGAIRKKKTKTLQTRQTHGRSSESHSKTTPPEGLAASFLFEDIAQ